jgi:hypothetical protein
MWVEKEVVLGGVAGKAREEEEKGSGSGSRGT